MSEFTGYEAIVFTIGVFGATFLVVYWLLDRLFGDKR